MNPKTEQILETVRELREARKNATQGEWAVYNNTFDAGVVTNIRTAKLGEYSSFNCGLIYDKWICGGEPSEGHFDGPDAEFVALAANKMDQLCEALEVCVEAMEELNEFTSSIVEDMEHYFENKCVPTADEVNQCAIADSKLRYAVGKAAEILGRIRDEV